MSKKNKLIIRLTAEGDHDWQNNIHVQRVVSFEELALSQGDDISVFHFTNMLRQLLAAVEVEENQNEA